MTALPEGEDLWTVVSQSGSEYTVDLRDEPACTCPDFEYNLPTEDGQEVCKHILRCQIVDPDGHRCVPAPLVSEVDPLLGSGVDAEPKVVATDGGGIITVDDEDEGESCDCSELPEGVPCFQCYRDRKKEFVGVSF